MGGQRTRCPYLRVARLAKGSRTAWGRPARSLDPKPGRILADGEENIKKHKILQAKTLEFLEKNIAGHGFISGRDGTHVDRTDLRLNFRVKHRLDELDELRACLEYAEDTTVKAKIDRLTTFKEKLRLHEKTEDSSLREWLNQNVQWIRREVIEVGCHKTLTISPPPAVGGLVMRGIDPFNAMFDAPYSMSLVPTICDMIDSTIGVLRNPPLVKTKQVGPAINASIQTGYAFVAMPIDWDDDQLVDVLEAIKTAAADCGITAERVDEVESNQRITDRILESIAKAEFVIVDLTKERPNVFFEAGFAHGLGKVPIYVARAGTTLHFDIKDYPIITFRNMRQLKDGITKRLIALTGEREEQ